MKANILKRKTRTNTNKLIEIKFNQKKWTKYWNKYIVKIIENILITITIIAFILIAVLVEAEITIATVITFIACVTWFGLIGAYIISVN
jgi:hypothetical protein